MSRNIRSWFDYGLPVVLCIGCLGLFNFLWNWFGWPIHTFFVYLIAGSLLPLAVMTRALRNGTTDARALGLAPEGWKPQHRLLGLGLSALMGYGGFASLADVATPPSFADCCVWFVLLLPASLAELLVFVSIGFCLPEKWLSRRGWNALLAAVLAALFSGVTFGLYHYTHESRWHAFALFPLIPIMWINLAYFAVSRNFQLTLLLHNTVAAVGFMAEQHRSVSPDKWMDTRTYRDLPEFIPLTLACFVVPYLLLHVVEWRASVRSIQPAPVTPEGG